ncbi:MAG: hypothetical protein AB7E72_20630 [Lysobacterales bacterium]
MRRFMGLALAACAMLFQSAPTSAADAAGSWEATQEGSTRFLLWSGQVELLGKPTQISLNFNSDPTHTAELSGVIGFDLYLASKSALAPFSFDDFEGPDAVSAERLLMHISVTGSKAAEFAVEASPSGWSPSGSNFAFGLAAPSFEPDSRERRLVAALAAEGAEQLRISIRDYRDPSLKLEFALPVAGQQQAFAALLEHLP